MQSEETLIPPMEEKENNFIVPWSLREILFSFPVILILSFVILWIAYQWPATENIAMLSYELVYLLPVALILLLKRAKLETLGLRNFSLEKLALGCGLLLGAYVLIITHNILLTFLGIAPQGEYLAELFGTDAKVGMLVFVGVVLAPFVEEVFFRGFLFGGLREKYGWKKAALISAAVFSIVHLQVAILIPAFLLGFLFAYLYQRSQSIWPAIILHLSVNSFTFASIYLMSLLEF